MLEIIKIRWLKFKLGYHYKRAVYLPEHVDCGLHMYHILRPDLAQSAVRFNEIMEELKELGEDVPTIRLPEL